MLPHWVTSVPQTSVVEVVLLVEVLVDTVEVEDVDVEVDEVDVDDVDVELDDVDVVLSVVEVDELVDVVDVDSVVLVVDVVVVVELVEFVVVVVVLGGGAHGQCAGRSLHAAMTAVSIALYFVSLSLLVDVGAVNREQNRPDELPNTSWTSTSPWGTVSSP